MNHQDHVNLLSKGIPSPGGIWADLGSGSGAFTLALAELVGPDGEIYSVDRDRAGLQEQERALKALFPKVAVHLLAADFTQPLILPALDGIIMSNSLHFQKHKEPVLERIKNYLRPGGHFILVEYNVDRGNIWVPYPLSYPTWEALAKRAGFAHTRLLATVPSRFLNEIFSADSW
jgi:ubiquinone/menaquinone biosynthesis C-methylase UbiE